MYTQHNSILKAFAKFSIIELLYQFILLPTLTFFIMWFWLSMIPSLNARTLVVNPNFNRKVSWHQVLHLPCHQAWTSQFNSHHSQPWWLTFICWINRFIPWSEVLGKGAALLNLLNSLRDLKDLRKKQTQVAVDLVNSLASLGIYLK